MDPTSGEGDVATRHDLEALARPLIRLVAVLAGLMTALFGVAFAVSAEVGFVWQALAAASVAVLAVIQILTKSHNAELTLVVAALFTVLSTKEAPAVHADAGGAVALAMIGIVASAFLPQVRARFIAAYSLLILAGQVYWLGSLADGVGGGLVTVVSFIFGAVVINWMRTQATRDTERFRNLFTRAPVSIWEEDFTGVADYLDELRAAGVVDLQAHMEEDPDVLRIATERIQVKGANHAAAELVAAEHENDLVGSLNPDTLTADAMRSIAAQILAVWEGKDHVEINVEGGRTLEGDPLDAMLSWTVPRIEGELDLAHVIVAIVDVTELRQAQVQLEALLRAKDEFVASVSHELRTPLTTVVGLALELRDSSDRFSRSEMRELVSLIAEQGQEVSTIVEDLLAAARAEAGTLDVEISDVALADELAAVLGGMSLTDRVPVVWNVDRGKVRGDPARVRQVVRNLLVNAQRYGGEAVRIVICDRGPELQIEVRDDGPPLPEDEREAIFDRFYQSRQVPGVTASVGIGLTVSRDLARRMDGDLVYEHDGTESIFRLTLRATTEASTPAMRAAATGR